MEFGPPGPNSNLGPCEPGFMPLLQGAPPLGYTFHQSNNLRIEIDNNYMKLMRTIVSINRWSLNGYHNHQLKTVMILVNASTWFLKWPNRVLSIDSKCNCRRKNIEKTLIVDFLISPSWEPTLLYFMLTSYCNVVRRWEIKPIIKKKKRLVRLCRS